MFARLESPVANLVVGFCLGSLLCVELTPTTRGGVMEAKKKAGRRRVVSHRKPRQAARSELGRGTGEGEKYAFEVLCHSMVNCASSGLEIPTGFLSRPWVETRHSPPLSYFREQNRRLKWGKPGAGKLVQRAVAFQPRNAAIACILTE